LVVEKRVRVKIDAEPVLLALNMRVLKIDAEPVIVALNMRVLKIAMYSTPNIWLGSAIHGYF